MKVFKRNPVAVCVKDQWLTISADNLIPHKSCNWSWISRVSLKMVKRIRDYLYEYLLENITSHHKALAFFIQLQIFFPHRLYYGSCFMGNISIGSLKIFQRESDTSDIYPLIDT